MGKPPFKIFFLADWHMKPRIVIYSFVIIKCYLSHIHILLHFHHSSSSIILLSKYSYILKFALQYMS